MALVLAPVGVAWLGGMYERWVYELGHVVPTHPQETNRMGRGIRIDAMPRSCRERLYEYLEQIPAN